MDVHPSKNGINRYWSIATIHYRENSPLKQSLKPWPKSVPVKGLWGLRRLTGVVVFHIPGAIFCMEKLGECLQLEICDCVCVIYIYIYICLKWKGGAHTLPTNNLLQTHHWKKITRLPICTRHFLYPTVLPFFLFQIWVWVRNLYPCYPYISIIKSIAKKKNYSWWPSG